VGTQPASPASDTDPAAALPKAAGSDRVAVLKAGLLAPPEQPPQASTASSGAVSGG
jgi:hypothetical protein